jgi:hypothetical protein
MILSLILSIAGAVATPAPTPGPTSAAGNYGSYGSLPVIITVHTNAVCSTLRDTVIPVGYIAKTNDQAFTDVKDRTLKVAMSQTSDDTDLVFLAHHDQSDVSAVTTNAELAVKLLEESEKRYPGSKNPDVEAMRQELSRIIDLQRQYNSIVNAISGAYLDSTDNKKLYGGFYGENTENVQTLDLMAKRDFINANRVLLGLQPFDAGPIANTGQQNQQAQVLQEGNNPLTQPGPSAAPGQQATVKQITSDLQDAEGRLQTTAIAALHLCTVNTAPTPQASP